MIYKDFQGKQLSALGLGCMRFPVIDGDESRVDMAATTQMVDYAIKHGINYFDTAWVYHGEQSEPVMGEILSSYPRESFYIATKFPGYEKALVSKKDEVFNKQLERLRVESFDFYLLHNVTDKSIDDYMDESFGIIPYLLEQKAQGRIGHLGFSSHASLPVFKRFLEAHGKDMEFCQIQLNWVDWEFQNAKEKVRLLNEYGIPVWVMEPLRGGGLVKLRPETAEQLKSIRADESLPALSFRYLQSLNEVSMILSGMSTLEQIEENIRIFETHAPLNEQECERLYSIGRELTGTVPCTKCRYCVSHCPQELEIPELLEMYNEREFSGDVNAVNSLPEAKRPESCIACQSCEAVCPQLIKISQLMADFSEKLKK